MEKHFVITKLVVLERADKKKLENPGGEAVLGKLGGRNSGLPFFAFADAKGDLIVNSKRTGDGGNIGHPIEPSEIAWFMVMLEKSAPTMAETERQTIEKWLKSQKR